MTVAVEAVANSDPVAAVVAAKLPESFEKNLNKSLVALLEYERKQLIQEVKESSKKGTKKNLLEVDEVEEVANIEESMMPALMTNKPVYITFGLNKIPENTSVKPQRISLPNPWKKAAERNDSLRVCVITKDACHESDKRRIKALGLGSITKIMSVSKLVKNFKPYEAKRVLCSSYDVFITDARVVTLLPSALGKKFFATKKIPVVVDFTITDSDALKTELETAINATYLHITSGPCFSVKIGVAGQKPQEIVENGVETVKRVVEKFPEAWGAIKSLHMKTTTSLSLPLFYA